MNIELVRKSLEKDLNRKRISAWEKGVIKYAFELLDNAEYYQNKYKSYDSFSEDMFLNGAPNWFMYSAGGCSLTSDYDIAKRLCTPSEFKRSIEGALRPNKKETWINVQERALFQAYNKIKKYVLN